MPFSVPVASLKAPPWVRPAVNHALCVAPERRGPREHAALEAWLDEQSQHLFGSAVIAAVEARALARCMRLKSARRDQVLVAQGDPAATAYIVYSGTCGELVAADSAATATAMADASKSPAGVYADRGSMLRQLGCLRRRERLKAGDADDTADAPVSRPPVKWSIERVRQHRHHEIGITAIVAADVATPLELPTPQEAAMRLQACERGRQARQAARPESYDDAHSLYTRRRQAVVSVQSKARAMCARQEYGRRRSAAVHIQTRARAWQARRDHGEHARAQGASAKCVFYAQRSLGAGRSFCDHACW